MVDDEKVLVRWYECQCEWITKYCDERHIRTALVPAEVLRKYVRDDKEERQW